MKKQTTKRALLLSALSLVICVTMLVGTTFAWFTDSVTSGRNQIVAGNLDVELEYWNGTDYAPVTSATKLFNDNALWEPGYTEVAYLKVSNLGSLALKYQLNVNVFGETLGKTKGGADIKLSDHLVFKTVESNTDLVGAYATREAAVAAAGTEKGLKAYNGATKPLDPKGGANADDYVALIIYMPTTVGNEANHNGTDVPSIEMGVNLLATQLTAEEDSFDDTYDENAWHPDFVVTNSDELKVALTNGGNVTLANDVIISESLPVTKDTVLDLNGKNIGTSGSTTGSPLYLQGGKLTVKNGTLDLDGLHTNVNGTFSTAIGYDAQTELVVENVNFTGKTAINGTFATDGPLKIAISDCTMDVTSVGIAVSANSTEAIATINNCNIDADEYAIFASQGSKITINGGTYKSAGKVITSMYNNTVVTINGGIFDGELWVTGGGSLVINGGTFTADPTTYVADGCEVINNGDGTYTVVKGTVVDSADELKNALSTDKDIVLKDDITFTGVKTPDRNNYVEAYGNKVGFAQYTGVFDGNGKTITDAEGDKSYVIVTHGGTIKNVTIKSGARGIVTYSPTENVYIDSVVVDGPGYALNSTEHGAVDMVVTDSTINGWTSLAGFNSVSFTDCKLGENSLKYWQGMGYSQDYDRLFRIYSTTTFKNCKFDQGYYLDLSVGGTLTLTNCTVNGVKLTAENYADYVTIELPSGKTLAECATFN